MFYHFAPPRLKRKFRARIKFFQVGVPFFNLVGFLTEIRESDVEKRLWITCHLSRRSTPA